MVSVCLSRATPRHPRGRPQTRTATLLSQALGAPPWRTTPSSRPGSPAVLALPTEEGPPLPLLQPDQPSLSRLPLPPVFPVVCSGTPEPLSCQSSPRPPPPFLRTPNSLFHPGRFVLKPHGVPRACPSRVQDSAWSQRAPMAGPSGSHSWPALCSTAQASQENGAGPRSSTSSSLWSCHLSEHLWP